METTTFIYALCEPGTRTVRYIGKTDKPKHRFSQHLSDSVKKTTPLGDWLRDLKSGGQKPTLVVLREVSSDEWEIAEERYIRLARGCRMNLVNSTDGGEGITMTPEICAKISASQTGEKNHMFGKTRSAETRAKVSAALKGEKHPLFGTTPSLETRAKMAAAKIGGKHTPEHCAKISASNSGEKNHNFGKPKTPETKAKLRAAKLGKIPAPETCAKISASITGEKNPMFGKTGEKCPHFGKKLASSSSKFNGVHWEASRKKWVARIYVDFKIKWLGRFENEVDAARAYDKAVKFYGTSNPLNFPNE